MVLSFSMYLWSRWMCHSCLSSQYCLGYICLVSLNYWLTCLASLNTDTSSHNTMNSPTAIRYSSGLCHHDHCISEDDRSYKVLGIKSCGSTVLSLTWMDDNCSFCPHQAVLQPSTHLLHSAAGSNAFVLSQHSVQGMLFIPCVVNFQDQVHSIKVF